MMNLYWPNMYTVKADGKIERYFTYHPIHTARRVNSRYRYDRCYWICFSAMWIEIYWK